MGIKRRLRRLIRSTKGVSEIVGDLLLLTIALSMAVGLAVYIYNLVPTQEEKVMDYDIRAYLVPIGLNNTYRLVLERVSGDILPAASQLIVKFSEKESGTLIPLTYNESLSVFGQKYVYDVNQLLDSSKEYMLDVIDTTTNTLVLSSTLVPGYLSYEEQIIKADEVDIIVLGVIVYDPTDGDNKIVTGAPLDAEVSIRIVRGENVQSVVFSTAFPTYLGTMLYKTFSSIRVIESNVTGNAVITSITEPSQTTPYLTISIDMSSVPNNVSEINLGLKLEIRDTEDLAPGKYTLYARVTSSSPTDPLSYNNFGMDEFIVESPPAAPTNITEVTNLAIKDLALNYTIYPPGSYVSGYIVFENVGSKNITSFDLRISLESEEGGVIKYVDYKINLSDYDPDGILTLGEEVKVYISQLVGTNNTGGKENGLRIPDNLKGRGYYLRFDAYIPNDIDYINNVWYEAIFLDPAILIVDLSYKETIFWSIVENSSKSTSRISLSTILDDSYMIAFMLRDLGYTVDILDAENGTLYRDDGIQEFPFGTQTPFNVWIKSATSEDIAALFSNYQLVIISTGVSDKNGLGQGLGIDILAFDGDKTLINKFFEGVNMYIEKEGYVLLIGGAWDDILAPNYLNASVSACKFLRDYLGIDVDAWRANYNTYRDESFNPTTGIKRMVGNLEPFIGYYWFYDNRNTPLTSTSTSKHYNYIDAFPTSSLRGFVYIEDYPGYFVVVGNTPELILNNTVLRPKVMIVGTPIGGLIHPPERKDFLERIIVWFFPREYDISLNMIWLNVAYSGTSAAFAFEMPVAITNGGSKGTYVIVSVKLVQRSTGIPIYIESDVEYLPAYGISLKYFSIEKIVTGGGIADMFAQNDILFIVYAKPIISEEAKEAYLRDNVYVMPLFNDVEADSGADDDVDYILKSVASGGGTNYFSFSPPSTGTPLSLYHGPNPDKNWQYYYEYGSDLFLIERIESNNAHHLMFFSSDGSTILPINLSEARFAYIMTMEYKLSAVVTFSNVGDIKSAYDGALGAIVAVDNTSALADIYDDRVPAVGSPLGLRVGAGDTSDYVFYSNLLWSGRSVFYYDLYPLLLRSMNKNNVYIYFDFLWFSYNFECWRLDNIAVIYRPTNYQEYLT